MKRSSLRVATTTARRWPKPSAEGLKSSPPLSPACQAVEREKVLVAMPFAPSSGMILFSVAMQLMLGGEFVGRYFVTASDQLAMFNSC